MNKKSIKIICCILLCILLLGCGKKQEQTENNTETVEYSEPEENVIIRNNLNLRMTDLIFGSNDKYYSVAKFLDDDGTQIKAMLVDKETKEEVLTETTIISSDNYYSSYAFNGDFVLVEKVCYEGCEPYYVKVYSKDLKEIASNFDSIELDIDTVSVTSNGITTTYDVDGNVIN